MTTALSSDISDAESAAREGDEKMNATTTKTFEIVNTCSGHSFGTWEANSAAEALDKYASDAGYESFDEACKVASGDDIEAREVTE